MLEAPNWQWTEGGEMYHGDRGTAALAVGPGAPAIPQSIALTEGFEILPLGVAVAGLWARDNSTAFAGTWSLRSNVIPNNTATDAIITVPVLPGITAVRFAYKVSSEPGFDFFRCVVNGNTVISVSGESGWVQGPWIPLSGAATVTFRYIKDSSSIGGSDAAWIDQLEFGIAPVLAIDGFYKPLSVNQDGQLRVTTVNVPPIKYAMVNAVLLTNIIVPLAPLKKIRVLSYVLSADGKVTARWRGLVSFMTGPTFLDKNVVVPVVGEPDSPLFETLPGEPLTLVLDSLTLVGGHVSYIEV